MIKFLVHKLGGAYISSPNQIRKAVTVIKNYKEEIEKNGKCIQIMSAGELDVVFQFVLEENDLDKCLNILHDEFLEYKIDYNTG
ncbi:MAG: hypothetical protein HeimC3_43850 [Candidatus Heimdallarchaeota archaeon LC_3]|nr:MAG: hypothetical protein HeimC3_43850 [Candidatus Heimdallarchaeota archaeon LC_3]